MDDNQFAEAESGNLVRPRRIDGPHSVGEFRTQPSQKLVLELAGTSAGTGPSSGEELIDFSAVSGSQFDDLLELDESPEVREQQLEVQTAQLAGLLQDQMREVERREALQNARAAELDNEFRRARLWITEKVAEVTERENAVLAAESKLADAREVAERKLSEKQQSASHVVSQEIQQCEQRHQEMEARLAVLSSREQELVQRQQLLAEGNENLAERQRACEAKESHLRERRQFIEREAAALHHARQEWERAHEAERADLDKERAEVRQELETALKSREEALAAGEILLADHTRELENDRQALARERADWQRQKGADREGISLLRHRTEAELEQRRSRLTTRETAVEQQQAALDQLRGEITSAHRQSIEMRLIAEQLWAQVQGRMPPAEITQSIAQLRLKLGEQYKMEQNGLAEQKQELLKLAEKVAEQSNTLRSQRHELQNWFAAREQEIEQHAEMLVTRERELLDQSDNLRDLETRWNADRRQLEQEVREMRSRIRQAA